MADLPDASMAPCPESIIRLATAVHRFSIPCINPKDELSFIESFKWCASNQQSTNSAMRVADARRQLVKKNMADGEEGYESLSRSLINYIPLINQILLSCKCQPEVARLDKPLKFSWSSGIEQSKSNKKNYFDSEAITFEIVLSLAAYALSESNVGCDWCVEGDFLNASRQFSRTAGVFKYLAEYLLPDWMNKNTQQNEMESESLAETRVGVATAFAVLFQAMHQQMALATVLAKPGVPNYALVGKMCLGVADELDSFLATLRSSARVHMAKIDYSFLKLVMFNVAIHHTMSLYFLARSLWNESEHGVAITALREATWAMGPRTNPSGRFVPEIDKKGPMQSLVGDVDEFKLHCSSLLKSWEGENVQIYFEEVPPSVPPSKALKGIFLKKAEQFFLEVREPLLLGPAGQSGTAVAVGSKDAPATAATGAGTGARSSLMRWLRR